MLLVVLAAVPGFAAQCYFFGYGTFLQVLLATLTAWLTEGVPITTSHHGASGGRLIPIRTAVSSAELSASVLATGALRSRRIAASVSQAVSVASKTCKKVP